MVDKRDVLRYSLIAGIFVVLVSFLIVMRGGPTGFAVFEESSFEGDFLNAEYNGSAVVLSEGDVSGSYTSEVFDAGNEAVWNNISFVSITQDVNSLFCVDAGGDIYKSVNKGINWVLSQENFGRTSATEDMFSNSEYLYILSSSGNEVWNSSNGSGFAVVYSGFDGKSPLIGEADSNGNLYAVTGPGEVWKSENNGMSWSYLSDFNPGTQNVKGITINSSDAVFLVDGTGDVYSSIDSGVSWVMVSDDYGGSTGTDGMEVDVNDNLYILMNTDLYKSEDSGVSWSIINESISPYANTLVEIEINGDDFFILDAVGRVFYSSDYGLTWEEAGDCNSDASNNPQGISSFVQQTSLDLSVRSCDDALCSGESFVDVDDNSPQDLSLDNNRYFQYKFEFTSPDSSVSPGLESVSIDYDLFPEIVYVDDDFNSGTMGWNYDHFDNVNDALDAVQSGGIIHVSSGDYDERLVLSKSVNLIGEDFETTKIDGQGVSGDVIRVNSNDVNISGFNITGSGTSWGNSGVYLNYVGNCFIKNNYFSNNRVGLSLISAYDNLIYSNYFMSSTEYGVYTNNWATSGNYFYDNYFDNSNNFYAASQNPSNFFNVTKREETNILGGQYVGGNYWNDYSGANRGDGFGDISYNVQGNYYDYLPLIDNTAPFLEIISPIESDYSYGSLISLNYTAYDLDEDLDSCWYILNSEEAVILNNCENTTFLASLGENILFLYANDSLGSETFANVSFNYVNFPPSVNLVYPQQGAAYGYNESLALNFVVSDVNDNLNSCWYNLGGENISLESCSNTSFDVAGDGNYVLTIYANDSLGEESSDSASFSVEIGSPSINLHYPIDVYFNSGENIVFNYTPEDLDLESCSLLSNFSGIFSVNDSDSSPESGEINSFTKNLVDGSYVWNIRCNDSLSNSAVNGNKSFYVDSAEPVLVVSEPAGTKSTRTNIPLTFSVSDSTPLSCSYNLTTSIGTSVVNNVEIEDCGSSSFSVSSDGDYMLYVKAEDAAGNSVIKRTNFSVDTSLNSNTPGGSSSSEGGGGGGGFFLPSSEEVIILSGFENVVVKAGDKKTLSLNIKNDGKKFLNNCRLVFNGSTSSWISSNQIEGVAPGESVNFVLDINIPEDLEEGEYRGNVEVRCDESSLFKEFKIVFPKGSRYAILQSIIQKDNLLNISYIFNSFSVVGDQASVEIWVVNQDNIEIKRVVDNFEISGEEIILREIILEIPEELSGIYNVYVALSSDLANYDRESVVLGKSSVTGRVIEGDTMLSYISIAVFVSIAGFFVFRFFMRKSQVDSRKIKGKRVGKRRKDESYFFR
jgi:photosystem II stability/assembly factor-like uncharacterized protein